MKSTATTPKEQKEEIKRLYALELKKGDLQEVLAERFEIEAQSVKSNWFGRHYSVPTKYRAEVIEIMEQRTATSEQIQTTPAS